MDGIFPLLIIIGIVNAIIKWAKKQQKAAESGANQGAAPDKPWQRMLGELTQTIEGTVSGKQQQPVKKIVTPIRVNPPAAKTWHEGESSEEGWHSSSTSSAFTTMTPNVQDTIHVAPSKDQLTGSLSGSSESAYTAKRADTRTAAEPVKTAQPALGLQFGRDALMQAVVMHEILTRPQDRRRRWGNR